MNPSLLLGILIMTVVNIAIWYQVNLQFVNPWFKQYPIMMSLWGFPLSYGIIKGTNHLVNGLDGVLWGSRLISFAIGIVIFAILTYIHMGQGLNIKTIVSVMLALILVAIQVYWK
jgi:hypothetical protein